MSETGDNLGRNATPESNTNANDETCYDLGRNVMPEDILNDKFPEGLRVLAVDDSIVCLTLLSALLKKCHYEVTGKTKATEALEILRKNRDSYDIVITDVNMLDMDGFELLQILTVATDIPVIMISANEDTKSVMRSIEEGAVDYLLKPVRIEELKNIWQHLVRKKHRTNRNILPLQRPGNGNTEKKDDEMSLPSDSESNSACKKPRLTWTRELHQKFVGAIQQIGLDTTPKKILQIMNEPGLSRWKVASHLQKYRALEEKESGKAEMVQQSVTYSSSNGANGDAITSLPNVQGRDRINNQDRYVQQEIKNPRMASFGSRPQNFCASPANARSLFNANPQHRFLQQNLSVPQWADQMLPNLPNPILTSVLPRQNFPRMVDEFADLSSHFPSFNAGYVVPSRTSPGFVPHSASSGNVNSVHAPFQMLGDASLQWATISQPGPLGMMVAGSSHEQHDISNSANGGGDNTGFPFGVQAQIRNYPTENTGTESDKDCINFNWIEDDLGAILNQLSSDSDLWL